MTPAASPHISQIEQALRFRFFPHVPKRTDSATARWSEDEHDVNRLSRSLAGLCIQCECQAEAQEAAAAITDGFGDNGIDAIRFDRQRGRLVVVQSKFKRGEGSPDLGEVQKTIAGIRALRARRFSEFHQGFHERLADIEAALDTPGVTILLLLPFLGEQFGDHPSNALDAFREETNVAGQVFEWRAIRGSDVYQYLLTEYIPVSVDVRVTLTHWSMVPGPRKAIYGQLGAAELADLVEQHQGALFEKNIRHYLGSVGVNAAIEHSVGAEAGDFFYLNNGITGVASNIQPAAGAIPERGVFALRGFSIVNGAQTAGAITSSRLNSPIPPDARLLLTVVEIGDDGEEFGKRVTRARNLQNTVRGVDFAALDPSQERIRQELATLGVTYHYRPSEEATLKRSDACTLEETALAIACLKFPILSSAELAQPRRRTNAVEMVVTAKRQIGRLWDPDGEVYGQLFPDSLTGVAIWRVVQLFRFLEPILGDTERAESSYYRRMFFRHGRYFNMAFVGHRLRALVDRPSIAVTPEDQAELSRTLNETAEMIYEESKPLQPYRGYLAVFRNLTDAQPLADGILRRLAAPTATVTPEAGVSDSSIGTEEGS